MTLVEQMLQERGVKSFDGPPMSHFYAPSGVRYDYVVLRGDGLLTDDHAHKLMAKAVCGAAEEAGPGKIVVWRVRPEVTTDDFGLYHYYTRLALADEDDVASMMVKEKETA